MMWWRQLNYTSSVFYSMTIIPLRASMLTLYYRLSPVKAFRWAVIIIFIINLVHGTIRLFLLFFACTPVAKFWNVLITSGHCINMTKYSISAGYTNILFDLALVILPLPTVWNLHLPIRQKIAVSGIFMAGLVYVSPTHLTIQSTKPSVV
jgi:hypothetical protein